MGLTEKAKEFADTALQKTGQMSETARGKAPDIIDKAADATVKALDAATTRIDRVTGGRFHDKLEDAAAKMEKGLDRPRPGGSAEGGPTPPTGTATPPSTPATGAPGSAGPQTPITPATTNPDATDADTSKP